MIKFTLCFIFSVLIISCTPSNIYGYDYRLFDDSPVEELADAVEDGDTSEIKELVEDGKLDVDYAEPKYGRTLLMLAVIRQQYNSAKMLLKLGADPNKHDTFSGESAIIEAAAIQHYPIDVAFVNLLLFYGGNPNDEETGPRQTGNTTRMTPLIVACGDATDGYSPIEKVKILIKAGADVNHTNEFLGFALRAALLHDNYDVALYLLKNGADYNKMLFEGEREIYIIQYLRVQFLSLDSREYKYKMKIVDFLKTKGLDYEKAPMPANAEEKAKELYPQSWQEYLKKY